MSEHSGQTRTPRNWIVTIWIAVLAILLPVGRVASIHIVLVCCQSPTILHRRSPLYHVKSLRPSQSGKSKDGKAGPEKWMSRLARADTGISPSGEKPGATTDWRYVTLVGEARVLSITNLEQTS